MAAVTDTLVQCCCACDCEQFEAVRVVWSFSNEMTTSSEEGGESHWSADISETLDFVLEYDPEVAAAVGNLIHDPEEAPDSCDWANSGVSEYPLSLAADFTYPDPDIPHDPDEDATPKTSQADLILDTFTVHVDCEGNGTAILEYHMEGGETIEIKASQTTAYEWDPLLNTSPTLHRIEVELINWQGSAELVYAPEIDPETGFGTVGLSTVAMSVEFLLLAP